jgi:hypothetical protein
LASRQRGADAEHHAGSDLWEVTALRSEKRSGAERRTYALRPVSCSPLNAISVDCNAAERVEYVTKVLNQMLAKEARSSAH